MPLLSIATFRDRYFEKDSQPCENTVRNWIANDVIPGRKIGHRYFVDEDRFMANGNPHLAKILSTR